MLEKIIFAISAFELRFTADRGHRVTHFLFLQQSADHIASWCVYIRRRWCQAWVYVYKCSAMYEWWMWGEECRRSQPASARAALTSPPDKRIAINSTCASTTKALRRDLTQLYFGAETSDWGSAPLLLPISVPGRDLKFLPFQGPNRDCCEPSLWVYWVNWEHPFKYLFT